MDPLTVAAGLAAIAGTGASWQAYRRARRAEARCARLVDELQAALHAANHDPLTGLPNRRAFHELGSALVADPARHPLVLVMLDLDNFKQINDEYGHAAGDEVLVTVARRFAAYAGDGLVARLGGDEFVGLLTNAVADVRPLQPAARRLERALAEPMMIAGHDIVVTASIGVVPVPGCHHLTEALHHADTAMYQAKASRLRSCGGTAPLAPVRGVGYPSPAGGAGPMDTELAAAGGTSQPVRGLA